MSIGQETVPASVEEELREFLNRKFIEISTEFRRLGVFTPRKQMPYKPQTGAVHYFGNPATHNYDAAITSEGFWGKNSTGWIKLDSVGVGGGDLLAANNLSDLTSASTARSNLDVDQAGTDNSTDVTLAGMGTYLSIIGQEITQSPIDSDDVEMPQYIKEIDDVSGTTLYIGEAVPGTSTAAAAWRLKRIVFTGDDSSTLYADGNANFDNKFDDRAIKAYS